MDKKGNNKKVSVKNIDKIIKFNEYENKVVTYKCGDEDIEIDVNPRVDYAGWYSAIESSLGILVNEDGEYQPALSSTAYDAALLMCFTNIKTDNIVKVIEIAKKTDIVDRVESALPDSKVDKFKSDFSEAVEHHKKAGSAMYKVVDLIGNIMSKVSDLSPEELADYAKILEGNG